jgi:hypothetical protein
VRKKVCPEEYRNKIFRIGLKGQIRSKWTDQRERWLSRADIFLKKRENEE